MDDEVTLDPSDWVQTRAQAHRMLDDILDYVQGIRERPVWQPIPHEVRAHFSRSTSPEPQSLMDVHAEFMQWVLPFSVGNVHPGFMGWVHGGGCVAGMLGEMLAAGLNANLGGRDHAPIYVERQIVQWAREIFGFPTQAGGLFVTGASMANFLAVLVARFKACGPEVRRRGLSVGGGKLTAYTSVGAHGCVAQAMDLCGLGTDALRRIPNNERHEIDVAALAAAIQADRRAGLTPFLVIATAGSVDTGAIDDLWQVAEMAQREGVWLHIDGALGALGMLAPAIAPHLRGIERADSIAFDFHKWGQVPYDAGFILVRDGSLQLDTFASPVGYLRRDTRGLGAGSPWPCDFGPDLSRGFRALKTWFTLKVYGTRRIGEVIQRLCELAQRFASKVESTPELELMAPVSLNIVCFRYAIQGLDAAALDTLNASVVADLHESGEAAPSSTFINGRLAIRAAFVNHRTLEVDTDRLLSATLACAKARVEQLGRFAPG